MLAGKRTNVNDCYDNAGNVIEDCMARLRQEERDWDNMKNQTTKPTTSLNGHSDEEYDMGTNPQMFTYGKNIAGREFTSSNMPQKYPRTMKRKWEDRDNDDKGMAA